MFIPISLDAFMVAGLNQFRDNVPITKETSRFVPKENPLTGISMLQRLTCHGIKLQLCNIHGIFKLYKKLFTFIYHPNRRGLTGTGPPSVLKINFFELCGKTNRKKPMLPKNSISPLLHMQDCYRYL